MRIKLVMTFISGFIITVRNFDFSSFCSSICVHKKVREKHLEARRNSTDYMI